MNKSLYVTIKNNKTTPRRIEWLARGAKWIDANGTLDIDYEPWSCADSRQRVCMAAALASKHVTLVLHVCNAAGEMLDVPYDPSAVPVSSVIKEEPAEEPKEEPAEAPVEDNAQSEAPADIRDEFNKLTEDKQWAEALKLLKSKFGADKVQISIRAIMAVKDYDAVVEKYELA